ncbi:MAG: polysaccharide deacetylase family protein, partial [Gloeomargaritaceae cyanobacterium C42_A2020_066]|nr:polysaccharide deacetylase family protein [Gloeomargaritaceae cyanobacterium C42_A2020_066]
QQVARLERQKQQGRRAQQYPQLIRRIVREGHELGNHTMNHLRREKVDPEQVGQEILTTQKVICNQGLVQSQLFRPPYGEFQPQDLDRVATAGLRLILWDVDTRDWQHRNPGQTVQAVVKQTRPGSIILMHDIFATTTQALPEVITTLRQRGLQPVTVSELLQPTQPASAPVRGRPQASRNPNVTASEFPRISAGG